MMDILAGGPVAGVAMNLARYFGTALASNHLGDLIVYFVGPAVGAVLGWAVCTFGLAKNNRVIYQTSRIKTAGGFLLWYNCFKRRGTHGR